MAADAWWVSLIVMVILIESFGSSEQDIIEQK